MDRFTKAIERAGRRQSRNKEFLEVEYGSSVELSEYQLKKNKLLTYDVNNEISDAYRLLRTRLLQRMRDNEWNILGVTSPSHGEGKSLTAINLAIAMSMDINQTVILIDADLRNPSVCEDLGIVPERTLVNYLKSNDEDFRDYLVHTSMNNLRVLPAEKMTGVTSELLTSVKMKDLLNQLKSLDPCVVICDMPSALEGDDVLAFSPYLDAILLVIEDGKTRSKDLESVAKLLERTPVIGSVLNKSQDPDL